ncbi:hypothetical protein Tco_0933435, partial [Tanacetum coccineum]
GASTNALTEADKRAKAAVVAGGTNTLADKKAKASVVAGGTNTLGDHKLLHPFHGKFLYQNHHFALYFLPINPWP